jgi:hypothetical protein
LSLESETAKPPDGAAAVRVTAQVDEPAGATVVGKQTKDNKLA